MRGLVAERVADQVRRACRQAHGPVAVERAAVEPLRTAVPFDAWCVVTTDPASLLSTGGYHEQGVAVEYLAPLVQIEAGGLDYLTVPGLARGNGNAGTLHAATGNRPDLSRRYREVLKPSGLEHELRVLFRSGPSVWGVFIAFRAPDAPGFSTAETRFVEAATAGVGDALRREMVLTEVHRGTDPEGPGLLLMNACLEPVTMTGAAGHWLAEVDDGADPRSGLPISVVQLTARALAADPDTSARSRIRTRRGRWLTLHADRHLGEPPQVSVIVEPTRPIEIAAIVADAYGLTSRERHVVRLLACGHSRHEIARLLTLSRHTVDDHVKHVFAKLGVRSRSELTYRLFFDQHMPRIENDVPIGAAGWFLR